MIKLDFELEKNKIHNYYSMSKENLIKELINIALKARNICEENHKKFTCVEGYLYHHISNEQLHISSFVFFFLNFYIFISYFLC